jgi:hypothetical protein
MAAQPAKPTATIKAKAAVAFRAIVFCPSFQAEAPDAPDAPF